MNSQSYTLHHHFKQKVLKTFPEIPVLYEDRDVLIVLKPAGLSTESGNAKHPSAEALLTNPRYGYLRAVHRLDRPASGLLILAKRKSVLTLLMAQFEQRKVHKTYEALVTGTAIPDQGNLSHWLKRDATGKQALAFNQPTEGAQSAHLSYEALQREATHTRLLLQPNQGRFHQIRAQLAAAGWPIIGDVAYGGPPIDEPHVIRLHARSLVFDEQILAPEAVLVCAAPW